MSFSLQETVFSRAKTLENWWSRQAALRVVESGEDASNDDTEEFSPIRGYESPPHLQAKKAFFAAKPRQSF